uniref:Transcription and mRNA export factor ENY2 n=1 Tax=Seriola dumerili TaxID=41447 RepID=A0A3B4U4K2_SERDU
MSKESRMRATINQKLTEMGEGERLKELLRAKLTECGWKDQMKAHCKEVIKDKGLEHVTVEDLMVEITPKGRGTSGNVILKNPTLLLFDSGLYIQMNLDDHSSS